MVVEGETRPNISAVSEVREMRDSANRMDRWCIGDYVTPGTICLLYTSDAADE